MYCFGDDVHHNIFASFVFLATVFSSLASIVMLYVIYHLKVWNGHILLVRTMTIFQLIYDLSFFTGVVNCSNGYISIGSNVTQLFSGIASSLVSNLVAWVAFYVIYFRYSFDIFKYYSIMMAIVLIPSFIDPAVYLASLSGTNNDSLTNLALLGIYYYIKLGSICLNFILVVATAMTIRKMNSGKPNQSSSEVSINKLSMRLFYYPIIQMISRSGCAWYEMQYHYEFSRTQGFNFDPDHTTNMQLFVQIVMAVSMPVASIGYLVVFLMMQPTAYATFKELFFGVIRKPRSDDTVEERTSDLSEYDDAQSLRSLPSISAASDSSININDLRLSLMDTDIA